MKTSKLAHVKRILDAISDRPCATCRHPESEHLVTPATAISKNKLCMRLANKKPENGFNFYCSCINFRESS